MSEKKSLYNRHNFTIAKMAAKESSRYVLNAILVTEDGTKCTDGHRLIEVSCPNMERDQFPVVPGVEIAKNGNRFLFPAKSALELSKQIPRRETIPVLNTACPLEPRLDDKGEVQEVGFVTTDLDSAKPMIVRKMSGTFPDTAHCYPRPEDEKFKIAVNSKYLRDMADWFDSFIENPSKAMVMTFYGPDRPILFEATNDGGNGQYAKALLMPTRL